MLAQRVMRINKSKYTSNQGQSINGMFPTYDTQWISFGGLDGDDTIARIIRGGRYPYLALRFTITYKSFSDELKSLIAAESGIELNGPYPTKGIYIYIY